MGEEGKRNKKIERWRRKKTRFNDLSPNFSFKDDQL